MRRYKLLASDAPYSQVLLAADASIGRDQSGSWSQRVKLSQPSGGGMVRYPTGDPHA